MKKFLLGLVVVFVALFTGVSAAENPRAVIIFDASGSMWGQINGKTKIEIAKDTLEQVVNEWNPDVSLGLTVYGHRTKGDCNDIETVIPVGRVDKNKILSVIKGIKPKGKTPIARSLKKVANEIKFTEEKATIILISDGKESCDPDPCGTAKALEKEGIDFVTHVIGFNVDKTTDEELACIASATGGEYFSAKNATALNDAMKVIARKVEKVDVNPRVKPVAKKLDNTVEISATEKDDGKWVDAHHNIFQIIEGGSQRITGCNSTLKQACTKLLPVGEYLIKSEYIRLKKDTPFVIKAGEVTKVHVVMGQTGTAEISASETEGGKWIKARGALFKADGDRLDGFRTGIEKPRTYQLAVGKYYVDMSYSKLEKKTEFEVNAGETTKVHAVMGQTGNVSSSASEEQGGKWVKAGGYVYPVDNEGNLGSWIAQIKTSENKPDIDQLPVGKYLVKLKYKSFQKDVAFKINAGETTKLHVIFSQFSINAKCSDEEAKVSYEIYASNGRLVYEEKLKCSETLKISLDDGDYTVEAKLGNGTKTMKFSIGADHPSKIAIDF